MALSLMVMKLYSVVIPKAHKGIMDRARNVRTNFFIIENRVTMSRFARGECRLAMAFPLYIMTYVPDWRKLASKLHAFAAPIVPTGPLPQGHCFDMSPQFFNILLGQR